MQEIRAVRIISVARVVGILYGLMGLLLVPVFLIVPAGSGLPRGVMGIIFAVAMPVIYGFMGFALGALLAWIYNLVAGLWGGIELDLRTK